ncbi:hypothetical protein ASAP_0636 [Asaia bogorensis]|uniref:Uncharacterized protein n=1 Tax=Asaia bogorensis TaxID=91915 RepID=A0A060QHJ3_9PROT|nr:hypothetical protein ASAP_0636 [Asaia bogorensis]
MKIRGSVDERQMSAASDTRHPVGAEMETRKDGAQVSWLFFRAHRP